jgi:DMSO reductase anchor subunit
MTIFIIVKQVYDVRAVSYWRFNPMNTKIILTSVIAGSIAAAAVLLSKVNASINLDSAIGYFAVATLLGIAALEYGLFRKRSLSK